jgi:hypothetical protein
MRKKSLFRSFVLAPCVIASFPYLTFVGPVSIRLFMLVVIICVGISYFWKGKAWTLKYCSTQLRLFRRGLRTAKILRKAEDLIHQDAHAWRCSPETAMKLHHLEKCVGELVHADIPGRLGELESRERWRTAKEWFALRDEWRRVATDPSTPPKLRALCFRCLDEFPQSPISTRRN